MTSANLVRLGGLAAVMAATSLLALEVADYAQGGDPFAVAADQDEVRSALVL